MPRMYRVRATSSMPERQAKVMAYRTRMMMSDITAGQEFELSGSDYTPLKRARWIEDVSADAPLRRGPGRPRKVVEETVQPSEQPGESEYSDMSVMELRDVAEKRGIALPSGYVRKSELIEYLDGRKVYEEERADEDDGA